MHATLPEAIPTSESQKGTDMFEIGPARLFGERVFGHVPAIRFGEARLALLPLDTRHLFWLRDGAIYQEEDILLNRLALNFLAPMNDRTVQAWLLARKTPALLWSDGIAEYSAAVPLGYQVAFDAIHEIVGEVTGQPTVIESIMIDELDTEAVGLAIGRTVPEKEPNAIGMDPGYRFAYSYRVFGTVLYMCYRRYSLSVPLSKQHQMAVRQRNPPEVLFHEIIKEAA